MWHDGSRRVFGPYGFLALAAIKWPEPTEADQEEDYALKQQYREEEDEAQLRAVEAEADAETRAAGMVSTL